MKGCFLKLLIYNFPCISAAPSRFSKNDIAALMLVRTYPYSPIREDLSMYLYMYLNKYRLNELFNNNSVTFLNLMKFLYKTFELIFLKKINF